jgi:DNA-binding MarR family transcriptional regulator
MLNKRYRFHLLIHSAHLLEERVRARLIKLGVTPRQARVLDALDRMGHASQVELAREFGLTSASMSTMTSRLLTAGLIERHVDERELRSNVLTLSKHGKSLLERIHQEWREIDQEICEAIGLENADQLASTAFRLRNALGGFVPGGELTAASELSPEPPGSV